MAATKLIAANLEWRAKGRTYELEAKVLVVPTGNILRLVGNVGVRNRSLCLLYNNTPIKRLCTKPLHNNPDGARIREPHKHWYYSEGKELHWAYVPNDIDFGNINSEFSGFLIECNITLAGHYQALML